MARKQQLAERLAKLQNPDAEPEAQAFLAEALVEGFTVAELTIKLREALDGAPAEEPVAPGSQEAAHTAADGPEPGSGHSAPEEEPGTDLVAAVAASAPVPRGALPAEEQWAQIERMAKFIAKSELAPKHLRGKPDDVQMILLYANDLGISATLAMQKMAVIEGQPAMTAELMVALVLREGHRIWPDPDNDRVKARAYGQRREHDGGWGPVMEASFTLDDAVMAGLCTIKDNQAWARSSNGKKLPWELYTPDLMWARAVSRLVRKCFADAGTGVTYVPEEIGYIEEGSDTMAERAAANEQATLTAKQERTDVARRISELPEAERKAIGEEWTRRNLPRGSTGRADIDALSPAALRTVLNLVDEAEKAVAAREAAEGAEIQEAEVVEDGATKEPTGQPNPAGGGDEPVPPTLDEAVATGAVTKGPAPADPDSEVAEGELVDEPEECACGDGPETPERPFVYSEDGKPYHADDAPMLG